MSKKLSMFCMILFTLLAFRGMCSAAELLETTDFTSGVSLPWHLIESDDSNAYTYIKDGKLIVHMDKKGVNKWDVRLAHRGLSIISGYTYTVKFSLTATKDCKVYAKIGDRGEPYGEAWNNGWKPYSIKANQVLTVNERFTPSINYKEAEFAFELGGELAGAVPYEIEFISMSLSDFSKPTSTPVITPSRDIRVNQMGYFPDGVKRATVKIGNSGADESPLDWQLKNSSGTVVAAGKTKPFGFDHASGDKVHIIDFTDYTKPGKGYQLVAGSYTSWYFDIGTDMYTRMKYDALKYFYHSRSGIELKMPYCMESKWARPAGHANDMASLASGKGYNGPYSIDATGGWYDGADYGKYVVNGGFALWMLQNQYEHSKKNGQDTPFGDGKLNIPESENNINDLLDETRWEMEWMLKMQIPEGYDRAGMAVHKLGDEKWLSLGLRPDEDDMHRVYYPPSTAATLNLAACAAQAARIWKDIDSEFSEKCMIAAESAYKAAKSNPAIFYPYGYDSGTMAYSDDYVEDDFYWAACEMYITTGNEKYLSDLKGYKESQMIPSVLTGEFKGVEGCFNRNATGGLGTLTLALNKTAEFPEASASIIEAANSYIEIQKKEGYGVPLAEVDMGLILGMDTDITGYPGASNSFIVNKAIVMAYAYDLSKDSKYFNGVIESMDYLMGRNPLVQCYVSGYGENP
ncbi:Cellulose 1,4-beta-cellobiosidase [Pseudobacteroides cellulosolvens ATCC 35603 = DSM 2933]|uniref:Cellulose 1,4-beta-cellobiosidase n=3 Tax=Pseudobacteroides cellulosolvens TaxID=35825 RepID=A0A0L6JNV4_9FIRM|nr:glycoside hydrolase family 9 protein [Pseudobacteroides cellulosolvens]KNY27464.1 Cellulose 1,4-beta-cellobiosidase [Pseudobacteroides cellulosolvens ATCC 35603 = DSM 2933]